jgi:hypothetical protein
VAGGWAGVPLLGGRFLAESLEGEAGGPAGRGDGRHLRAPFEDVEGQADDRYQHHQNQIGRLALFGSFPGPPGLADEVDGPDDHRKADDEPYKFEREHARSRNLSSHGLQTPLVPVALVDGLRPEVRRWWLSSVPLVFCSVAGDGPTLMRVRNGNDVRL